MQEQPITQWMQRVAQGDATAAEQIFRHFQPRLEQLARKRLVDGKRRVADEEDVVVMALNSFFRGARSEKFAKLDDRDDLWQVLALLTTRKAIDQVHRENRQKRGGGAVQGESIFRDDQSNQRGIHQAADSSAPPDLAAQMVEELDEMLAALDDQALRTIALAKLNGSTNEEIATEMGVGLRTIERKLKLIRAVWEERVEG